MTYQNEGDRVVREFLQARQSFREAEADMRSDPENIQYARKLLDTMRTYRKAREVLRSYVENDQ